MSFRASPAVVERWLTITGAIVVICVVVGAWLIFANPFASRPPGAMSLTINTPYVGEGVRDGTDVVLHGVPVGKVVQVKSVPGGGVQLLTELQSAPVKGMTDAMQVDFRPINYFGITGVDISPGPAGRPLRDGMVIAVTPKSNSTLQALLSRLGEITADAVTPQLVSVIDRSVRYTDGLNPMIETMLVALDAVARVQTVPAAQLLANATGISVTMPAFTDSMLDAGYRFTAVPAYGKQSTDFFFNRTKESIKIAATVIFGDVGRLESKYVDDLLPAVDATKALADPVPNLFRPSEFGRTLTELRSRFEKLYAGSPGQRALQVRIALDNIPGVAAPLGIAGAP